MADILTLDLSRVHDPGNFDFVYQEEETEDMAAEEVDPLSDEFSPEDSFPPLRRILTYYKSDKNDDRHLCLRLFPDALQCMTTMTELNMLLQVVFTLAKDHFHIIRIGLLSNLPSLLEKNKEFALGEEEIAAENRQQLLNILIRLLADSEVEVRRVGHNILGMCISGEADPGRVEELMERLFPVVKRFLGRDENYDLRIDVAMLISKLSSLLGQANVLKYFLPLLADLSTDTMFHVRKAFAVSCREMCAVLEEAMVEQHILPLYLPLCKDEVWGVRKACADVFSDISISCNLGTRYDLLTPVFLKLLHDDSRWVRKAAYQSLGAFIATFYIPNGGNESAATEGAQEGEGEGDESTLGLLSDSLLQDNSLLGSPSTSTTSDPTCAGRHPSPNTTPPIDDGVISNSSTPIHNNHNHTTTTTNINTTTTTQATTVASVADAANPEFNNFEFWRSPIPSVEDREKSKLSEQPGEGSGVVGKLDFEGVSSAEERCSIEASPCLAVAGEVLEEQGSSEAKAAQAGTEGSGEEEEKGEGGSGSGEGSDQVEALASERAEKAEEWVEAANCEVDASVIPPAEPANRSNMSAPTVVTAVNSSSSGPPSAPAAGSLGPVVLRGRVSGSPAVRRVSMDQSLMSPPNKRILHEKKRRRWSLNAPNHTNLPQVRVFVHSVSGQVTEQEVSPTPDDVVEQEKRELSMSAEMAQTMCEDSEGGNGGGELSMADASLAHDVTITKSVAMDLTFEPTNNKFEEEPYVDQEIVPDELMEIYLSMTEHSRVQTVDTDLLYYCAYSLPGVTLTLGKKHWELLKPTFDYLVEDLQWKIRRVLSFSLHELARVLGTDITCRDILPIFEEYCTKDVDDVKIGVLSHLAEFFELIPDPLREKCLPMVLEGLLQMENQRNWRYRLTLVEQLLLLCELFESEFLHQHIYPLALILSEDKVAEVRSSAGFLIGTLLQRIGESGSTVSHTLLQRLRSSLVDHPNWLHRLM